MNPGELLAIAAEARTVGEREGWVPRGLGDAAARSLEAYARMLMQTPTAALPREEKQTISTRTLA